PRLARGEILAAFAVTEPGAGSDLARVETTAEQEGGGYVLSGVKRWISFGQIADLFLVLARCEGGLAAFLGERDRVGLLTHPIAGMLGLRASMLAEVRLEGCRVPGESLLGRVGFGLSPVVGYALSLGRYSVAWGCVGLAQACLDASLPYIQSR